MDQSGKADSTEVSNKLIELSEAATYLEANWFNMDYMSRDKAWWRVHRASRAVWNMLHPPNKRMDVDLQSAIDDAVKKGGML